MKSNQSGFSLIELMVVITIASILLSFGIPNLKDFLTRQSITTKANDMLVDFAFARAEAINGGTPVSIAANPTWDKGWIITTDNNGDGILESLRVSNVVENEIVISDPDDENPIIFNPTGTLKSASIRQIIIKHEAITQYKTLTIALSGNTNIY
jgi:type IV fimbrial biogenesis protein FimT